MVPELPTDIWLQIMEFIPAEELDRLMSLSSLFFNVVMKERYQHVDISNSVMERRKSMFYVRRLADPFIGGLVRSLRLRLEFLLGPMPTRPSSPGASWKDRIQGTVSKVIKRHPTSSSLPAASNNDFLWFEEMAQVFPTLVNLKDFAIHLTLTPASVDFASFLIPAWNTFSSQLRMLSLGGDIDSVRRVVATKPYLPSLNNLSMEFVPLPQQSTQLGLHLAQDIVPFLNDLAPQLETFRLWCWGKFDFSDFLKRLGPFPALSSVTLRAQFDNSFQNDGTGIPIFLSRIPKLHDLELRLNPQRVGLDPSTEQPLAQSLSDWTSDSRLFKDLKSLQIYPTNRPEGIDIILNCIERSSHSLTGLTIRDRYLDPEEVARVVLALKDCSQLLYLRMNIRTLNIDIFDMLYKYLPHLRKLWLLLTDAFGASENMEAFLDAVQGRQYTAWHLTDLGLWQGGYDALEYESRIAIGQRIPTLKRFWGVDERPFLPITLNRHPFP